MNMTINIFAFVAILLGCILAGAIAGFYVTRYIFKRQLEKNPPVNRNMIRAMYMQMGRKPSEKDITRVLETMNVKEPEPKKKKNKSKSK